MSFKFAQSQLSVMLGAALVGGEKFQLFSAHTGTIGPDSVLADFTLEGAGWATEGISSWNDSYATPTQHRASNGVVFTYGGSPPQSYQGYVLLDSLGNYKGADLFAGGSFTFTYLGQTLQITADLTAQDA